MCHTTELPAQEQAMLGIDSAKEGLYALHELLAGMDPHATVNANRLAHLLLPHLESLTRHLSALEEPLA